MYLDDKTKIAGKKTVGDWKSLKPDLADSSNSTAWGKAYNDFFSNVLRTGIFNLYNSFRTMENGQERDLQ